VHWYALSLSRSLYEALPEIDLVARCTALADFDSRHYTAAFLLSVGGSLNINKNGTTRRCLEFF
jgi:hypothetical protein